MRYESTDVALQSTGAFDPFPDGWASSLPLEEDVQLSENLWLGGLQSPVTSSQVMDACSPRGLNHNPVRQFGCRYAFFRIEKSKDYPQYEWDSDGLIGKAIFVSRLIHPTTIGTSYSAKIITTDGKVDSIVPGPINSIGSHAWIVANTWRDWLTTSEAKQLAHILPVYLSRKPTERLRHARRHIDHAFHSFYLDQRVASLVTSFESLIKVGRGQLTYQFAERVSQLARHLVRPFPPSRQGTSMKIDLLSCMERVQIGLTLAKS